MRRVLAGTLSWAGGCGYAATLFPTTVVQVHVEVIETVQQQLWEGEGQAGRQGSAAGCVVGERSGGSDVGEGSAGGVVVGEGSAGGSDVGEGSAGGTAATANTNAPVAQREVRAEHTCSSMPKVSAMRHACDAHRY